MDAPTSQSMPPTTRLSLGRCTLDLDAGELFDAQGELAGLRKQALEVLLVLGRRAGQVVGKDELMTEVWPRVVVGEGSLTQAIADVRRALGDDDHRLVRTVARRGYQLVQDPVPAVPQEAPAAAAAAAATIAPTPVLPPPDRRRRVQRALVAVLVLLVIVITAAELWRRAAPAGLSPADLARALQPRDAPPLSILVLPLSLEGESGGTEWLADALHGDLVVALARLANGHVIARDTAASYRGKAVDPRQAAREMGVRHVVRGSLRQEAATLRVNVVLIDGDSGVQRWAETFGTDRAQLAQTVGDLAVAIERTLVGEIYRATVERRSALAPHAVTADDLAMQGYATWYRGVSRENLATARALFERALVIDPDSPRAWAGVAFTTTNQLLNGWTDDRAATLRRTDEAVLNLERVDRDGSPTYSAKTFRLYRQGDHSAMLRHTTEWAERYRLPLAFGAQGAALTLNDRFDDAVPVIERALRLGPRDPFRAEWQYRLALAHYGAGRLELARDWSQSAANTNARLVWPPFHAAALLQLGQREAARQAFDEHMRRHPTFTAAMARSRLPGTAPGYVRMRERLLDSLRQLGLRD